MSDQGRESRSAYAAAGVDIDAQDRVLSEIEGLLEATRGPEVLTGLGTFGGMYALSPELEAPVLVASADGVGTKLRVAAMAGDYSTVGHDLVNHCVNDILVQGARPLFFLDYVGAGRLDPEEVVALVEGLSQACVKNRCALLGGETAEMPGFYREGDYELVGFVVGIVERERLLRVELVEEGDVLLGLASSGLHTNGYSLAREILFDRMELDLGDPLPAEPDRSVSDALLAIHRTYLPAVEPLLGHPGLRSMAHITGGGLVDNVPRALPEGRRAEIDPSTWTVPALFELLGEEGEVSEEEMFRVFNMGIGLVLVVTAEHADDITELLVEQREEVFRIGRVVGGVRGVEFV